MQCWDMRELMSAGTPAQGRPHPTWHRAISELGRSAHTRCGSVLARPGKLLSPT